MAHKVETDTWASWITAFGTFMTMLILALTLIVALRQLSMARAAHEADRMASINSEFRTHITPETYGLFRKYPPPQLVELEAAIYDPAVPSASDQQIDDWDHLVHAIAVFESIGLLAARKAISYDLVYDMWGGDIDDTWRAWKDAIGTYRSPRNDPHAFHYFRSLVKR